MAKKIVYDEIGVTLYAKGSEDGILDSDKAKVLLGWDDTDGRKGEAVLRDVDGCKVFLDNNITNRPFRLGIAKRYASEMLRGKWALTGETMVIDKYGHLQQGQHRLVGLVLAEQMRKANPEKWGKKPIGIDAIVVTGIESDSDTVDKIDDVQKRTLGDILFRGHMASSDLGVAQQRKAASTLAGAIRLCWLRTGGLKVSDAPHFPKSEATEFLGKHPGLRDATLFIMSEDGGERRISNYISPAYASGLLYLMATMGTIDSNSPEIDWDKAQEFWVLFAGGTSDLHSLRLRLGAIDAGGSRGRDEVISTVIKAYHAWLNGEPVDAKTVKVKTAKDDSGKARQTEWPRLGGLDVDPEDVVTGATADVEEDVDPKTGRRLAKKNVKAKPKGRPRAKPKAIPEDITESTEDVDSFDE